MVWIQRRVRIDPTQTHTGSSGASCRSCQFQFQYLIRAVNVQVNHIVNIQFCNTLYWGISSQLYSYCQGTN